MRACCQIPLRAELQNGMDALDQFSAGTGECQPSKSRPGQDGGDDKAQSERQREKEPENPDVFMEVLEGSRMPRQDNRDLNIDDERYKESCPQETKFHAVDRPDHEDRQGDKCCSQKSG